MKKISILVVSLLLCMALAMPAFADPPEVLATPTVTVLSSTHNTVTVQITAGAVVPGAPAGFTLHWMAIPTDWSGTWPASGYSVAVFDGTAAGSPFSLAAGGSVNVMVGIADTRPTVTYDPATASNPLAQATLYAFRVKANPLGTTYDASAYSASALGVTSQLPALPVPSVAVQTSATTQTTLTLRVTAGATAPGAPAGFTLHWMPVPTGWSGVWPSSGYNVAVFDGTPTSSPFALAAGGIVDVVVGTLDTRSTVSYDPVTGIMPLQPGKAYVFRVKANAVVNTYNASAYSTTALGTTTQQSGTSGSTEGGGGAPKGKGKGYYKNHLDWPGTIAPTHPFFNSGMTWGEILKAAPKGGDTYIKLAQSYVTAMLRIAASTTPPPAGVTTTLNLAQAWFSTPTNVPGVRANSATGKTLLHWAAILSSFNGQLAPTP
jgi:hypothetical protein